MFVMVIMVRIILVRIVTFTIIMVMGNVSHFKIPTNNRVNVAVTTFQSECKKLQVIV